MNVLERIDKGELVLCEWFDGKLGPVRWSIVEPQQAELLRLSRLGEAAEKAIENGAMFTQFFDDSGAAMCNPNTDTYGENCDYRCTWQDFCRIRAEKGAG